MKSSILILCLMFTLSACGIEQINEGSRGIKTRFGKVEGDPLTPGLYFYNPLTSSIFDMNVKEEKIDIKTQCFTRDTQTVTVEGVLTYYPEPTSIQQIFSQFGKDWENKVIMPATLGSIKDAIGQYIADDLISKREAVKVRAFEEIKSSLLTRKVVVTRLDITNLDFDDAYEKAVESKVTAIQRAAEAKNKTVQIDEEAKQTVSKAQAEATSMRIRSQALTQNKALVSYEAVHKWDGKLPQFIMGGGSMPMLDLKSIMSTKD